jgi:hypothetical protein
MKKSPLEVFCGRNPIHVLDFLPLPNQARMSMEVEDFA